MFEQITFEKDKLGGKACIRGLRIPVFVVLGQIAEGATFEEILDDYPSLEEEDIRESLRYAAWLAQDRY
jgi:uncharacterized protein (DUF433 family)